MVTTAAAGEVVAVPEKAVATADQERERVIQWKLARVDNTMVKASDPGVDAESDPSNGQWDEDGWWRGADKKNTVSFLEFQTRKSRK